MLAAERLDPVKDNPSGELCQRDREHCKIIEKALYQRAGNTLELFSGKQGVQDFMGPE